VEGQLLDGRYRILRALRTGGFGQTFIGEDTRRPGNPTCVVKQLKPAVTNPTFLETARRLFQSEAETLEFLGHHDQIPRLLAFFEQDKDFYLVQEYIEGQPLTVELTSGHRWSEFQVIQLLHEILGILDFVHGQGVIHRDIKPDNIIRRRSDNRLVLVDFGAVKQVRSQVAIQGADVPTIAVGTPGYMPSEQGQGKPRPSSDIYALGMIGIQALTGINPNRLPDDPDTGEILWQQYVRVSPELAMVLSKMVKCYFKERYSSAAEARKAVEELAQQSIESLSAKNLGQALPTSIRESLIRQAGTTPATIPYATNPGYSLPYQISQGRQLPTVNQSKQITVSQRGRGSETSTKILLVGLTITTLAISLGGIYTSGVLDEQIQTIAPKILGIKVKGTAATASPSPAASASPATSSAVTPPKAIASPTPAPVAPAPRSAARETPAPPPIVNLTPAVTIDNSFPEPSPSIAPSTASESAAEPTKTIEGGYREANGLFELALPSGYTYQETGSGVSFVSSDSGFGGAVDYNSAQGQQLSLLELEQALKSLYESRLQEVTWQSTVRRGDGRLGITWVGKDMNGNSLVATSYVEQRGDTIFMLSLYGINRTYSDYRTDAEEILSGYRINPG
jgi:serine/threonine protein kinase